LVSSWVLPPARPRHSLPGSRGSRRRFVPGMRWRLFAQSSFSAHVVACHARLCIRASGRSRSAMICRRSDNILPQVELICDLVGPCSPLDHTCINLGLHRVVQQRRIISVRRRVAESRSGDSECPLTVGPRGLSRSCKWPGSAHLPRSRGFRRRSLHRTHKGRSALAAAPLLMPHTCRSQYPSGPAQ
jgi:hypothetical protein